MCRDSAVLGNYALHNYTYHTSKCYAFQNRVVWVPDQVMFLWDFQLEYEDSISKSRAAGFASQVLQTR